MPVLKKKDFLILYGSQTGQAEAISEEIFDVACKQGYNTVRFTLGDIDKKYSIEKETCVVIICSTTGEGEAPDNAGKFLRRIKKKTLPSSYLSKLSYTLLALGDSNYTSFCNCGKNIEARLNSLGANHFYETGYADDAVGLEKVVEPWIEDLFSALKTHLTNQDSFNKQALSSNIIGEIISTQEKFDRQEKDFDMTDNNNDQTSLKYSPDMESKTLKVPSVGDPYLQIQWLQEEIRAFEDAELPNTCTPLHSYPISSVRSLTTNLQKVKHALEIELDLTSLPWEYQAGDSFGIVCQNKKCEVDYLLTRLNIDDIADKPLTLKILENTKKKAAKVPTHIHYPSTLRYMLTNYLDFRAVPRKAFLRLLIDYTTDDKEKRRLQELCSSQGIKEYGLYIREPLIGLVEILTTFESCLPPVVRILEFLPRLLPREYSAASSPHTHTNHVKFVFNVIQLPAFQNQQRYGLCSKWLEDNTRTSASDNVVEQIQNLKIQQAMVKAYLRKPTNFRFPEDPSRPVIMIGPGTGVAPFIGFLQQREYLRNEVANQDLGEAILFYGCRYKNDDYLYKEELHSFVNNGILTELHTSFSRDQVIDESANENARYVQDNIRKQKDKLMSLIFKVGGAVFICGDAKHMGRDVTNLFVEIIEEHKSITKVEAIKLVNELREKKQFLEDVWT